MILLFYYLTLHQNHALMTSLCNKKAESYKVRCSASGTNGNIWRAVRVAKDYKGCVRYTSSRDTELLNHS